MNYLEHYFLPFDLCKANEIADESLWNFDSLITEFMKEQRIPGGAIALSYNGRLIHKQGYGSTGNGSRCLSTSYFRMASISKTITAMAIMQLVEQNKLQLKDKVFSRKGKGILPNFVPDGPSVKSLERISVRHLLEHSGGWDRETGVDPVYLPPQTVCPKEYKESTTPEALYTNYHTNLIQYMIKQALDFKPGTRHGYSNFGYLVLGQVLEKLTGIPFPVYIHDVINQADDFWVYEGDELQRLDPNEVTYFENSDRLHPSIMPHHGEIWSMQYGGYHMKGTGSYGGLVASPLQLFSLLSTLDFEHW
ncbi:putative fimbrial assembly protein FimD, serogroup D isoform X1 [Saccostrea cucullata]